MLGFLPATDPRQVPQQLQLLKCKSLLIPAETQGPQTSNAILDILQTHQHTTTHNNTRQGSQLFKVLNHLHYRRRTVERWLLHPGLLTTTMIRFTWSSCL